MKIRLFRSDRDTEKEIRSGKENGTDQKAVVFFE